MQVTTRPRQPPTGGRPAASLTAAVRKGISSGQYEVGQFLPSVRELRRRHGLAGETVRRAIKALEAEGLVRAEPRHGFRVVAEPAKPDRTLPLSYLMSGPPGTVAEWSDLHRTMLLEWQHLAARQGRSLLTVSCGDRPAAEVIEQVRGARVCGAAIDTPDPGVMEVVGRLGLPAVLMDNAGVGLDLDAVAQDGFAGAAEAAIYLAARGHRKIAWIGPHLADADWHITERFSGTVGGLSRAGLRLDPSMVVEAPYRDAQAFEEAARRLLSRRNRPSGIVALWQHLAHAVARAAAGLGLRLGKDLEMVGWCTTEAYRQSYAPAFPEGRVPPTMVWSVKDMVAAANAKLEERRAFPDLPRVLVRIRPRLESASYQEGQP